MRVKEILKATGGKLLSGDRDAEIDPAKISTDSRSIRRGELFIALSGPNFKGSDFVRQSLDKGAVGVIADRIDPKICGSGRLLIQVKNGTEALGDIACCHRNKFKIPMICVTGSNGKTTVKDMIAEVLSTRFNVLKNEGTKNNNIGVPQTLLKLTHEHDICVLELGTNHRGEIRSLAKLARPTIAVITNVGPSHLEFLNNLKGVYDEKRDILKYLDKKRGVAIVNGDDEFLSKIKGGPFRLVRYGIKRPCPFRAEIISTDKDRIAFLLNGKEGIDLNLLGVHNVYNALAAIAVASKFKIGYDLVRKALGRFRPTGMRLNLVNAGGIDIINDAYNSNPLSMKTAIDAMKQRPARARWVVCGDMLELGPKSVDFHRMVGELIASAGIEGLLTFGDFSRHTLSAALTAGMDEENLWHCATHDEIVGILKQVAQGGDIVLVKGSRSMRMEKVVEKLTGDKR